MTAYVHDDTIAAISTPPGRGAIGIVRISGPDALSVADRVFRTAGGGGISSSATHTVHYGHVVDPSGKGVIDEALATVMRAPSTFTRQDTVEINCHGGPVPLGKTLEACLGGGARLAGPGEFTRRAFLNGRIDLSQAEAVADIIQAENEGFSRAALAHLNGALSDEVRALRRKAVETLSSIELRMDFSAEDVEFPDDEEILAGLDDILGLAGELIRSSTRGMVLREGLSAVICGRPNVGKSSLMNALLRDERVIVTPVPGTTRDIIEESIIISGVKIRLSDTAGMIETTDRVELEGIRRSRERLEAADIVIFILDSSRPLSEKDVEIYGTVKDKAPILVMNKCDLERGLRPGDLGERLGAEGAIEVSALKRTGLAGLEEAIAARIFSGETPPAETGIVTSARHRDILSRALEAFERARAAASGGMSPELAASDLNEAVRQLGLITGDTAGDEVLDEIFSRFCIGK